MVLVVFRFTDSSTWVGWSSCRRLSRLQILPISPSSSSSSSRSRFLLRSGFALLSISPPRPHHPLYRSHRYSHQTITPLAFLLLLFFFFQFLLLLLFLLLLSHLSWLVCLGVGWWSWRVRRILGDSSWWLWPFPNPFCIPRFSPPRFSGPRRFCPKIRNMVNRFELMEIHSWISWRVQIESPDILGVKLFVIVVFLDVHSVHKVGCKSEKIRNIRWEHHLTLKSTLHIWNGFLTANHCIAHIYFSRSSTPPQNWTNTLSHL